eukprot:48369-Chlamydomonas_euryale.AAC.1
MEHQPSMEHRHGAPALQAPAPPPFNPLRPPGVDRFAAGSPVAVLYPLYCIVPPSSESSSEPTKPARRPIGMSSHCGGAAATTAAGVAAVAAPAAAAAAGRRHAVRAAGATAAA